MIVLLDAGPLGIVTNPRISPEAEACKEWLTKITARGIDVTIPEIADYEVRRELLRAGKQAGLARLTALRSFLRFVPITSPTMLRAAEFWARARNTGRQSAEDASLDADMILAAQATELMVGQEVMIATTNVRHLALFAPAQLWRDIG
jgi:predicted nucleic acid-binding protein